MQGRLGPPEAGRFQSFPCDGWRLEFARAAEAGLDSIEWIYDAFGQFVNPLASDSGIAEIKALSARHGVEVVSVCADYFMDRPIAGAAGSEMLDVTARLYWLLERCARLGVERVVVPFVDASSMRSAEDRERVAGVLGDLIPLAERANLELHLETDLRPEAFAAFLDRCSHPSIKVNYDSGNSASLGYDAAAEFAAYGSRVGSVHIKDRVLGGGTVPLGSGDADLDTVFRCLGEASYSGDFILQAARGEPGAEVSLALSNRRYLLERMRKAEGEKARAQ